MNQIVLKGVPIGGRTFLNSQDKDLTQKHLTNDQIFIMNSQRDGTISPGFNQINS